MSIRTSITPDLPYPPLEGQVGGGILLGLAVVRNVL
jgi:hypothetical protein